MATTEIKFRQGKHFEEKIVQALIVDHQFAEQIVEVLDTAYFNVEYLRKIAEIFIDFNKEYKSFPTFKTLMLVIKNKVENDLLLGQIKQYFARISKDPLNGDAEFIKEESLDFCKKRSLALALEQSLDCINDKKFDQIVPIIQKALIAGSERDIGHVFLDNDAFEERMKEVIRDPIATPWPEINEITQGGAAKGELWVIAASTGCGKSHWLVDMGHYAALNGYNVVHYTFELDAKLVGRRYDARYSNIAINDLIYHKEEVKQAIDKVQGKLIIKSYPTKAASCMTIKSHIHKLAMKDQRPDLILVDYGDLMRSSRSYEQKRFEEEAIYEELRTLAGELQVPVVTATQTNRSSLGEEVVTLKHVAECFQKAMIADVFITLVRRKQNSVETPGNFYVAKNRLGPDGVKFNIMANTSISKFRIIPPEEVEEEEGIQERLRAKFKEFNKEQS